MTAKRDDRAPAAAHEEPDTNDARDRSETGGDGAARVILERLRTYNLELDRLMRLQFFGAAALDEFLLEATQTASRLLSVQRVSVWVYTEARDAIRCLDLYEAAGDSHSKGVVIEEAACPAYFSALASCRVIDAHDAETDPRTREFTETYLRPLNIKSMMDAQIPSSDGVRGVICCETVGERREWSPDEASFAASLAELVGLALERAERGRIMSELERSNKRIQEQSAELAKLALVAQHTEDIVVITNKDRLIEWVNPAFEKLTEYSLDEVRGRSPGQFLQGPRTDPLATKILSRALADNRPVRTEILNYSKSGRPYWLEIQIDPIFNEQGEVERFIAVERDVTERIDNENKLAAALSAAEQASAAKSTFLATMSHEIRTPMNGVMGMIASLEKTGLWPEQQRMVDVIRDAGDMLLNVLNDVLDFSRIEAGEISLERIPFQIDDLARKIESLHKLKAREKGVELTVERCEGMRERRLGDPNRILQILHNLVSNAIKFTEKGEVAVYYCSDDDLCAENEVMFEVKDTGIGMTADQVSRIFERFQQADDSTTRQYGGSGLGLSIVEGLAAAMGGRIEVDSAPGRGSTFRVFLTLPRAPAETAGYAEPGADAPASADAADETICVLAAEDNAMNRIVLQTLLEPAGIAVMFAENGREAVDALRDTRFDVVLMDIQMPVMDGEQALAEIRRQEKEAGRAATPVFAVTAITMEHQIKRYAELGFDGYVAKPIEAQLLYDVIHAAHYGGDRAATLQTAG